METDTTRPCRVFIVDDHPAVREGLALLLEQHGMLVCGDAEDGAQTMECLKSARPHVVLVDLSLRRESGMALIEQLRALGVAVLVYSMHEDVVHVKRAFAAGAGGYVTKREGADVLVQGIQEVVAGRRYLGERARNALIDGGQDDHGADAQHLSDREALVLQWIGEGDSSEEIARRLHISSRTVETYCGRIIEKLDLGGMRELRRYAIQRSHEGSS